MQYVIFFFSSRRRHTRSKRDWSSDVCSSDLGYPALYGLTADRLYESGRVEPGASHMPSARATRCSSSLRCHATTGCSCSHSILMPALASAVTTSPTPWFHDQDSGCSKVASALV